MLLETPGSSQAIWSSRYNSRPPRHLNLYHSMNITDYISFFEDKPTAQWITGALVDASGRHCAVGFLRSVKINDSSLQDLLAKHKMPGLVQLNDDYRDCYDFGDSPKERILAALRLINLFEVLEAYHRSKGDPRLPECLRRIDWLWRNAPTVILGTRS